MMLPRAPNMLARSDNEHHQDAESQSMRRPRNVLRPGVGFEPT